jgi:hypothetical protein
MIDRLLRLPLAPQLKAVLEKLDNITETSSLDMVDQFVRTNKKSLTPYESFVLRRALRNATRMYMLDEAMEVVLATGKYAPFQIKGRDIAIADITNASLKIIERNLSGNAPIKREGARVNY